MKYVVEVGLGVMIYISSFIMISSDIQKLKWSDNEEPEMGLYV
jgi:hypothetical protein